MGEKLEGITFEQWLKHVFDHPVRDLNTAWYWDVDRVWWEEDTANTVHYMTRTFQDAALMLEPYSDAQLNQGLWFLVSNACSSHMFSLINESIPWDARRRCIASIHQLFEQCFARRCSQHLSHIDEEGANPLNLVCYMWWDIIPIGGAPADPKRRELDEAILQVMETTLQLDSIACRESALHGLGHWQHEYPARVGEIIDRFSMSQRNLPEKLEVYMRNAYVGYVL